VSAIMQDFTQARPDTIKFRIDNDVFEAVSAVGANLMRDIIGMTDVSELTSANLEELSPEDAGRRLPKVMAQVSKTLGFLDTVLLPDSAQRFAARMNSATEPITLDQAFKVWTWLVEQYSGRPTQPSSPSANGHDGTGTSSTAGALAAG